MLIIIIVILVLLDGILVVIAQSEFSSLSEGEFIWKIANALELPLEVLFEKLVEYYSEEENLSAQAYNILDTLSKDDQRLMLTILNCIVKFRNNK